MCVYIKYTYIYVYYIYIYSCLYTYMYVYIYVRVYLLIYFEIQRESERERERERLRAHVDSRLFGKHSEARCEAPVFQLETLSRNPETSTEAPRRCAPDGPAVPRIVASGVAPACGRQAQATCGRVIPTATDLKTIHAEAPSLVGNSKRHSQCNQSPHST